jgi:hypothetical protein
VGLASFGEIRPTLTSVLVFCFEAFDFFVFLGADFAIPFTIAAI